MREKIKDSQAREERKKGTTSAETEMEQSR